MRVADLFTSHSATLSEADCISHNELSGQTATDVEANAEVFERIGRLEAVIVGTRSRNLSEIHQKAKLALRYATTDADGDDLPHEWQLVDSLSKDIEQLVASSVISATSFRPVARRGLMALARTFGTAAVFILACAHTHPSDRSGVVHAASHLVLQFATASQSSSVTLVSDTGPVLAPQTVFTGGTMN